MNALALHSRESHLENALRQVLEPEVVVPNNNTIRALAASIAFVSASAIVAGAAVFHLSFLGFGSQPAASATTPPVQTVPTTKPVVTPRKVVRTRYVDVIVHRPSPVRAVISSPPPAPAAVPAVATIATALPSSSAPAAYGEPEHEHEHGDDAPPGAPGSTRTTTVSRPSDD